jgi:WhiB family redox-sensing transcriptional regulator
MSTATLLAALSIDVDDWFEQGSCVLDGADLFFDRHDELGYEREAEAKARCASCPVLDQCRQWALAAGEPSGVWAGGTTTAERMALPREYDMAS